MPKTEQRIARAQLEESIKSDDNPTDTPWEEFEYEGDQPKYTWDAHEYKTISFVLSMKSQS